MTTRLVLATVLAVACCGAAYAAMQDPTAARSEVTADKLDRMADHVFKATGNVKLTVGGGSVPADSIDFPTSGKSDDVVAEFVAEGNVVFTRGQERLTFQRLQFNPQAGTGAFQLQQPGK